MEEIRQTVVETLNELRLHDQKMSFQATAIKDAQDRLAIAVEKVADAADAIRGLGERIEKRNGAGLAGKVNAKNLTWLVGLALMAGIALGSGNEMALRIIRAVLGK